MWHSVRRHGRHVSDIVLAHHSYPYATPVLPVQPVLLSLPPLCACLPAQSARPQPAVVYASSSSVYGLNTKVTTAACPTLHSPTRQGNSPLARSLAHSPLRWYCQPHTILCILTHSLSLHPSPPPSCRSPSPRMTAPTAPPLSTPPPRRQTRCWLTRTTTSTAYLSLGSGACGTGLCMLRTCAAIS